MMNDYLETVMSGIDDNHGTVDKLIGDEVMALYGAPKYYKNHAFHAIASACAQIRNLDKLRKEYKHGQSNEPLWYWY